jgi:hypothetical protein
MENTIGKGVLFIIFLSIPLILWVIKQELERITDLLYKIWTKELPRN